MCTFSHHLYVHQLTGCVILTCTLIWLFSGTTAFQINEDNGTLTVATGHTFNYNQNGEYKFTVIASDGSTGAARSAEKNIIVYIRTGNASCAI